MPVDNNMPHGNHFASNGPRPGSAGSSANGNCHTPAPDTTKAFMMASRSGRTTKPAPAQPVASLGARTSMGGQDAYQQGNLYQQQGRAYTSAGRGVSAYGAAQASSTGNAYSADGGSNPKKGKGKIIALVVESSSSPSWRLEAPRASSFIRTRRIFRRRQARSCLRSRP